MKGRITHHIEELSKNEIFVFGSNVQGKHAGGAARLAHEKFGAEWGMEEGLTGQTYAIPTVDFTSPLRMDLADIRMFVDRFIEYAKANKDKKFLVTEIGCGIAGFKIQQIAPMFRESLFVSNISLPKSFWDCITNMN